MVQKTEDQAGPAADTVEKDSPLLDLTDQSVKKLLKLGKQRGYVTHDELNAVLPSEEVTPDAIEDTMAMLNEMRISVVDQEETHEHRSGTETLRRLRASFASIGDTPLAKLTPLQLDECSVKIPAGGPDDDPEDLDDPAQRRRWSGTVPLHESFGTPVRSDACLADVEVPDYIGSWRRS